MADKSVGELIAAQSVTPTDLFVLEQNGTAKKLTGQLLENWLVSFADGHGGIQSIEKLSTNVLADTYRITLADTTTFDFVVTNGRGITGISKTSTSGLVDTYTISYNNGTTSTFTVTNGEKGDKGDNSYIWIKYASQEPTESSHSMGDIPDNWIGIYYGNASFAPSDWKQYQWFKHKGEKGDTGNPATLASRSVTYQVGDSGTIIPSGSWVNSVPVVRQGKYLWTKTEVQFNTGDPIVSYSVARMGIDGSGSVSSVAGVPPDATGNVVLTADDVGAVATVCGVGPDENANIDLTAEDVGAVATVCGVGPDENANIDLTAEDVGARPDTWMPSASEVGAVSSANVVNNFSTTEAGFAADARTVAKLYEISSGEITINDFVKPAYLTKSATKRAGFATINIQGDLNESSSWSKYSENLIGYIPEGFQPMAGIAIPQIMRNGVYIVVHITTDRRILVQPFADVTEKSAFGLFITYPCAD